jgi:peptide/nickel transport system permease protein
MTVSMTIGMVVGGMAGHFGGLVDNLLMRITDTLLSTPTFYILLAMTAYAGSLAIVGIVIIIAATSWMGVARIMRAEFLSLREREFVVAAVTVGATDRQIIWRHILPNVLSTAIVAATLRVGGAILVESSLSFLGLGVQPPAASWGTMLSNAQLYVWQKPILAVYPGACIMVAVLCFNFIGDGLREAFDPRLVRR